MRYAICLVTLASALVAAQPPAAPPAPSERQRAEGPAPSERQQVQGPAPSDRQRVEGFRVEEATIAQIHEAMKAGRLTCRALVDTYLRRIHAYDKNGPALNALVVINPDAQKLADDLDRRFAQGGLTGPLHCVP